jgi:hypothetical protein
MAPGPSAPNTFARDIGLLAGFAGLKARRFRLLPVHREVVASAEPAEVLSDEPLDPSQVFLAVSFGAKREGARAGVHCARAPAEADFAVSFGPFDVYPGLLHHFDARPQLGQQRRATVEVCAPSLEQVPALVIEMLAELDKVPARAFGLNMGLSGQHGKSLLGIPAWAGAFVPTFTGVPA